MTHASAAGSELEVDPSLIRLSVGLETVDDLLEDLDRALALSPMSPRQLPRLRGRIGKQRSSSLPERVRGVHPPEQPAALLGPGERGGRGQPAVDLQDPALEDPVLGPAAREVLHARHLPVGDVTGLGEPPHPVAVGVPGEIPA